MQRQCPRMQLGVGACRGVQTGSEWSGYCGPWLVACNPTHAQEYHTEDYSNDGLGRGFWSFLGFFQPDSFSLQTGVQDAATSMCHQLPCSNQGFPRVQREDDGDSPGSLGRPQHLWNTPGTLLKVCDFWSHSEGRVANFIDFKTFCLSGPLKRVPWILCYFIPVWGGKDWHLAEF